MHSCLDFMAAEFIGTPSPKHDIEQLVFDVTDAFWSVPTRLDERRFVTIQFRGRWLVFKRAPQGTRGAPLARDVLFGPA